MNESRDLAVVIMAAGKGTRMNNPDMAKVMYTVAGKPMVEHVVDLAVTIGASRIVAVTGWQKESVINHLRSTGKPVECVVQEPQLGTGHAVLQAEGALNGARGDVVVLSGDVPLLTGETVQSLMAEHRHTGASATLLTAVMDDPTGYGRILRNSEGAVTGIVEQKDATPEQIAIREINSGIYVFDIDALFAGLHQITPNNAQKEYYLTDVFACLWANKSPVRAVIVDDVREIQGVNTPAQLEEVRTVFEGRARTERAGALAGLTMGSAFGTFAQERGIMSMKQRIVIVAAGILLAAMPASGQFRSQLQYETRVAEAMVEDNTLPSVLFGWFDASRFQMRHSVSFGYSTFGGKGCRSAPTRTACDTSSPRTSTPAPTSASAIRRTTRFRNTGRAPMPSPGSISATLKSTTGRGRTRSSRCSTVGPRTPAISGRSAILSTALPAPSAIPSTIHS